MDLERLDSTAREYKYGPVPQSLAMSHGLASTAAQILTNTKAMGQVLPSSVHYDVDGAFHEPTKAMSTEHESKGTKLKAETNSH